MDIDLHKLTEDLKEATGESNFKLHNHKHARLLIRVTDKGTNFFLNPAKIRSQQQLDAVISDCQQELCWGR